MSNDHHQLDDLAQDMWLEVQRRIGWMRGALRGPTPVGFKKAKHRPPDELDDLLAIALGQSGMLAGLSPNLEMAKDVLGDYSYVLQPFLAPAEDTNTEVSDDETP